MLRWTIPFLVAVTAIGPAIGADGPVGKHDRHLGKAPAKSRQPHKFKPRITQEIRDGFPRHQIPRDPVEEASDLLFTPTDAFVRRVVPLVHAPVLPGSSTLPGYYGSTHSYDYQGPYYGGQNLGLWNRLPYACGVYGYC